MKKSEFWREVVDHINETWKKKKGRPYPFTGKDTKHLSLLLRLFSPAEVMAMYTCYAMSETWWGKTSGWSISGLLQERTTIIDHADFHRLVREFEQKLELKTPKQVVMEFGL